MTTSTRVVSDYYTTLLDVDALGQAVDRTEKALRAFGLERFEGIAFAGVSGALVAPTVANRLSKPLIIVRKDLRNCHSTMIVEGTKVLNSYVIVDDFMLTGRTINRILEAVRKFTLRRITNLPKSAVCVGIFLYRRDVYGNNKIDGIPVQYLQDKEVDAMNLL